jgi:hypothetical protein
VIVAVPDSALVAVVGRPDPPLITRIVTALAGDVNVLAQMEDADHIGRALPRWRRSRAIIHVLPAVASWEHEQEANTRVFTAESAPQFDHVPDAIRRELLDALRGRTVSRFVPGVLPHADPIPRHITVPMAAVWADGGRSRSATQCGRRKPCGTSRSRLSNRTGAAASPRVPRGR